jgi:DNA-binding transcriptional ArsR family regulator
MLRLTFTPRDLATIRFAFSPLWEVVASVRVVKDPASHPMHAVWSAQARSRLAQAGPDWPMLSALVPVPTRVMSGILSPPPAIPSPDLELELAAMLGLAPDAVRAMLDELPGPRPSVLDPLYDDPPAGLHRLADAVRRYWDLLLAPHWPRILRLLEDDVLYRARRLTEGGTSRLFADLDPRVRWQDDTLLVVNNHFTRTFDLAGRGLLLVPSVFVWPRVFARLDPGWQPTLRYPTRGVARVWDRDRIDPPEALAAVLGQTRTLLLTALDMPASTTDLARETGLSPGGVSQHLTAMRAAGLVDAHRRGRYVLYARTSVAESLLAGVPDRRRR